jgi:hypothetical protein
MLQGGQHSKASIWSHVPILTPERKIWRAVLGQAYLDAELTSFPDGSDQIETLRAQRYLRADSSFEAENLGLVCDFAEIPADRVILWARRRYPLAA